MKLLRLLLPIFLMLPVGILCGQGAAFVYQGQFKADGEPFNGEACFRFVLIRETGGKETVVWVNEGKDLKTVPPVNPVCLPVKDGKFSLVVGDTTLEGMEEIPPSLFESGENIMLRVWADDGTRGLQQLSPDRLISQESLFGFQTRYDLTLYVDPEKGDDSWLGIHEEQPKKTIQAAIDSLPDIIGGKTIIRLADGTYRESVVVRNIKKAGPDVSFSIVGNKDDPTRVIISGKGLKDEVGLSILNCVEEVAIQGITVRDFADFQFFSRRSTVYIGDCRFVGGESAMRPYQESIIYLRDVVVEGSHFGINSNAHSFVSLTSSTIQNCDIGFHINQATSGWLREGTVIKNCQQSGVYAADSSTVSFEGALVDQCGLNGENFSVHVTRNSSVNLRGAVISNSPAGGVLAFQGGVVSNTTALTTMKNLPVGVRTYEGGVSSLQESLLDFVDVKVPIVSVEQIAAWH